MALTNKQKAKNALRKLFDKYGDIRLEADEVFYEIQDEYAYDDVFGDYKEASDWFNSFCAAHDLEVEDIVNGSKRTMRVVGWENYIEEPYFMLWLNKDDRPHIEMGASYMDLWSVPRGLQQLENKMTKIVEMKQ